MAILKLQEEYLSTKDNAKLEAFYQELLGLGINIRYKAYFAHSISVPEVYDLVADICLRLAEKGQPVIKGAPSSYVRNMFLYHIRDRNKAERKLVELDTMKEKLSVTDVPDVLVDNLVEEILLNIEIPEDLRKPTEDVLRRKVSLEEAKAKLKRGDAWRLAKVMGDVKAYVRQAHM